MAPRKGPAIGIDLGTWKCCVGVVREGKVEIIENERGSKTTPSYVAFTETERLVGEDAKDQVALNPTNTVFGVKRIIGRRFDDPDSTHHLGNFPFKAREENTMGGIEILVQYKGTEKVLPPEHITAMLLRKMKLTAEAYLGCPVQEAVVSVPSCFNSAQRQATLDAAEIAGLKVLQLLHEPTAVALAYKDQVGPNAVNSRVIVVDAGGGTLEVSVVIIEENAVKVLATSSDDRLGGLDLDLLLIDDCVQNFQFGRGCDLSRNKKALERLRLASQEAKYSLTLLHDTVIFVDSLVDTMDLKMPISRIQFSQLVFDLTDGRIKHLVRDVLQGAKLSLRDVDQVIVVGGSTRVPSVFTSLQEALFCKNLNKCVNADEAVAHGAALQAALLAGDNSVADTSVWDVSPCDFVLEHESYWGSRNRGVVFHKNRSIPRERVWNVSADRRGIQTLHLYEGNNKSNKSYSLPTHTYIFYFGYSWKVWQTIPVRFSIDENGLFSAPPRPTGGYTYTNVHQSSSLKTCLTKIREEEQSFQRDEQEEQERVRAISKLESSCFGIKTTLEGWKTQYEGQKPVKHFKKMCDSLLKACDDTVGWLDLNPNTVIAMVQQRQTQLDRDVNSLVDLLSSAPQSGGESNKSVNKSSTAGEQASGVNKSSTAGEQASGVNKSSTAGEQAPGVNKSVTGGEQASGVNKSSTASEQASGVNKSSTASEQAPRVNKPAKADEQAPRVNKPAKADEQAPRVNKPATASEEASGVNKPATASEEASGVNKPATPSEEASGVNKPATVNEEASGVNKPATPSEEASGVNKPATASEEASGVKKTATASKEASGVNKPATASEEASGVNKPATASEEASGVNKPATTSEEASGVNKPATASEEASGVNKPATASEEASEVNKPATASEEASGVNKPATAIEEASGVNKPATVSEEASGVNKPATAIEEASGVNKPATASEEASGVNKPATAIEEASGVNKPATASEEASGLNKPATASEEASGVNKPATASEEASGVNKPATASEQASGVNKPATASEEASGVNKPATASEQAPRVNKPATASVVKEDYQTGTGEQGLYADHGTLSEQDPDADRELIDSKHSGSGASNGALTDPVSEADLQRKGEVEQTTECRCSSAKTQGTVSSKDELVCVRKRLDDCRLRIHETQNEFPPHPEVSEIDDSMKVFSGQDDAYQMCEEDNCRCNETSYSSNEEESDSSCINRKEVCDIRNGDIKHRERILGDEQMARVGDGNDGRMRLLDKTEKDGTSKDSNEHSEARDNTDATRSCDQPVDARSSIVVAEEGIDINPFVVVQEESSICDAEVKATVVKGRPECRQLPTGIERLSTEERFELASIVLILIHLMNELESSYRARKKQETSIFTNNHDEKTPELEHFPRPSQAMIIEMKAEKEKVKYNMTIDNSEISEEPSVNHESSNENGHKIDDSSHVDPCEGNCYAYNSSSGYSASDNTKEHGGTVDNVNRGRGAGNGMVGDKFCSRSDEVFRQCTVQSINEDDVGGVCSTKQNTQQNQPRPDEKTCTHDTGVAAAKHIKMKEVTSARPHTGGAERVEVTSARPHTGGAERVEVTSARPHTGGAERVDTNYSSKTRRVSCIVAERLKKEGNKGIRTTSTNGSDVSTRVMKSTTSTNESAVSTRVMKSTSSDRTADAGSNIEAVRLLNSGSSSYVDSSGDLQRTGITKECLINSLASGHEPKEISRMSRMNSKTASFTEEGLNEKESTQINTDNLHIMHLQTDQNHAHRTQSQQAKYQSHHEEAQSQQEEAQSQQEETQSHQAEDQSQQEENQSQQAEKQSQQEEAQSQQEEAHSQQEEAQSQQEEAHSHQEEAQSQQEEVQSQQEEAQSQQEQAQSQQEGTQSHQAEDQSHQEQAQSQKEGAQSQSHEVPSQQHKAQSQQHKAQFQQQEAQSQQHKAQSQQHKAQSQQHKAQSHQHRERSQQPEADIKKHCNNQPRTTVSTTSMNASNESICKSEPPPTEHNVSKATQQKSMQLESDRRTAQQKSQPVVDGGLYSKESKTASSQHDSTPDQQNKRPEQHHNPRDHHQQQQQQQSSRPQVTSQQKTSSTHQRNNSAIGIDLGTWKCCVGVVREGKVEIIENERGSKTTPSYVAFTETERLVGEDAKDQVALNPTNTVFGVKRIIGRRFDDQSLQNDMKLCPYTVSQDKFSRPRIPVRYRKGEKVLTPELVSAMMLEKMKCIAESHLGCQVIDAVISVPANFNNSQRQATKDAGAIAGLNVLGLISEPTAAALAYRDNKARVEPHHVLIFDLGGGTFDVAVIRVDERGLKVKGVCGDTEFGGNEMDVLLMERFAKEFTGKHGKPVLQDKKGMERLRTASEKAKKTLTLLPKANVQVDSLIGDIDFNASIKRHDFEQLFYANAKEKIEAVLENVLQQAKIRLVDNDELVLVGGTSRIPKVQSILKEFFGGKALNKTVNPDEAVAHGAALQAALLAGNSEVKEVHVAELVQDPVKSHLGGHTTGDGSSTTQSPKDLNKIPLALTESEVTELVDQVRQFGQDDQELKEGVAAMSDLEAFCFQTMAVITSSGLGQKLGQGELKDIAGRCEEMICWLDDNDSETKSEYQRKKRELCGDIFAVVKKGNVKMDDFHAAGQEWFREMLLAEKQQLTGVRMVANEEQSNLTPTPPRLQQSNSDQLTLTHQHSGQCNAAQSVSTSPHSEQSSAAQSVSISPHSGQSNAAQSVSISPHSEQFIAAQSVSISPHSEQSNAAQSVSTSPHSGQSNAAQSVSTSPHSEQSNAAQSVSISPHSEQFIAAQSVSISPHSEQSNAAQSVSISPHSEQSNAAQSVSTSPHSEQSNAAQSVSISPHSEQSNAAQSVSTSPHSEQSNAAQSVSTSPHSGQSNAAQSVSTSPQSEQSNAAQSVSTSPHSEQSNAAQSVSTSPHSGQSNAGQSVSTSPHSGQSNAAQSVSTSPHSGQSNAGQSVSTSPHSGQSNAGQSVSTSPHSGQSNAAQSVSTSPHSGQSNSAQSTPHNEQLEFDLEEKSKRQTHGPANPSLQSVDKTQLRALDESKPKHASESEDICNTAKDNRVVSSAESLQSSSDLLQLSKCHPEMRPQDLDSNVCSSELNQGKRMNSFAPNSAQDTDNSLGPRSPDSGIDSPSVANGSPQAAVATANLIESEFTSRSCSNSNNASQKSPTSVSNGDSFKSSVDDALTHGKKGIRKSVDRVSANQQKLNHGLFNDMPSNYNSASRSNHSSDTKEASILEKSDIKQKAESVGGSSCGKDKVDHDGDDITATDRGGNDDISSSVREGGRTDQDIIKNQNNTVAIPLWSCGDWCIGQSRSSQPSRVQYVNETNISHLQSQYIDTPLRPFVVQPRKPLKENPSSVVPVHGGIQKHKATLIMARDGQSSWSAVPLSHVTPAAVLYNPDVHLAPSTKKHLDNLGSSRSTDTSPTTPYNRVYTEHPRSYIGYSPSQIQLQGVQCKSTDAPRHKFTATEGGLCSEDQGSDGLHPLGLLPLKTDHKTNTIVPTHEQRNLNHGDPHDNDRLQIGLPQCHAMKHGMPELHQQQQPCEGTNGHASVYMSLETRRGNTVQASEPPVASQKDSPV